MEKTPEDQAGKEPERPAGEAITTAYPWASKKIGQTTEQPDNAATRGKIKTIIHLIEVTE